MKKAVVLSALVLNLAFGVDIPKLEQACDDGNTSACNDLVNIYSGYFPKYKNFTDVKKSALYSKKACDFRNSDTDGYAAIGCYNTALNYYRGSKGIEKDLLKAQKYLNITCGFNPKFSGLNGQCEDLQKIIKLDYTSAKLECVRNGGNDCMNILELCLPLGSMGVYRSDSEACLASADAYFTRAIIFDESGNTETATNNFQIGLWSLKHCCDRLKNQKCCSLYKQYNPQRGSDSAGRGVMFPLKPFALNLLSDGGARYVKCTMQLEQNSEVLQPELEKKMDIIREIVIRTLTSKTFEEVITIKGKERLKDELVSKINEVLTDGFIKNIYFTDFVVQ